MVLGFAPVDLVSFLLISLLICIAVCALAMEAAVLFTPSFLFVFPALFPSFPALSTNEAIGLAFVVEVFGYTSSVSGYWYRGQIDFTVAKTLLVITVPLAVIGRIGSYFVPGEALLLVFGLLLLVLAWVIYRYHPEDASGTCLLCGDALVPLLDLDDPSEAEAKPTDRDRARRDGDDRTIDDTDRPAASNPPGSGSAYHPRRRLLDPRDTASATFPLDPIDRLIVATGGAFAGLVGIAIGEISNTFQTVRKRVPIKRSTGTSALILHLTILTALLTNVVVLTLDPPFVSADEIAIPWLIGALLAPVVVLGGQIGSLLNNRLADTTVIRTLIVAYVVVGLAVIGRTLLL